MIREFNLLIFPIDYNHKGFNELNAMITIYNDRDNFDAQKLILTLDTAIQSHFEYISDCVQKRPKIKNLFFQFFFDYKAWFYNRIKRWINEDMFKKTLDFDRKLEVQNDKKILIEIEMNRIERYFLADRRYISVSEFTGQTIDIRLDRDIVALLRSQITVYLLRNTFYRFILDTHYYIWLLGLLQEISPNIPKDTPSVSIPQINEMDNKQPLARHWALFFAYWYQSKNEEDTPITTAILNFSELFKPVPKSETIRKKYIDFGFRHDSERQKYKEDVKYVINHFLKDDLRSKELAEKDVF